MNLKKRIDREPIWRRLEDKIGERPHKLRNAPTKRLAKRFPKFENRNFGGGVGVGIVQAAIITVLEDTVGVPFGADADVTGVNPVEGGIEYTVDVNAPSQNIAQARAFIDAGTGFTTILTDLLDVRNVQVSKTRMIRDTYRVTVLVED